MSEPVLVCVQSGVTVEIIFHSAITKIGSTGAKTGNPGIRFDTLDGQTTYRLCPQTNQSEFMAKLALSISRGESMAWSYPRPDGTEPPDAVDTLTPLTAAALGL